ncbi:MAG TPA: IS1380 family transposase [Gemmataceae bacterium]|nr:IS1380 family transposase [Gemmataceae bacterium]
MSFQLATLFTFDFFQPLTIQIQVSDAPLTSDAGLLPLRQFDEHIGLTKQFAAVLDDPRDPDLIEHSFTDMVRMRVFGILAGYEDQNDHDTLRADPVFKLIADRSPSDADLASQPTLSRFENQINIASLKRLREVFVDQFIASFAQPPLSLTFDLDAVDDPTHGSQQLTLFHAFCEQYQYLPLVITSAETGQVVMVSLRHGTAAASLGADDDLEYLVVRVRAAWPNVRIRVRGDGGFGNPTMYEVCERLAITYTFGLSTNPVLQRASEALLAEAVRLWEETRQPQRLFAGFWYRASSWPVSRFAVVKAEANAQGTNRRFVVTNRAGASQYLEATYDEYVQRGESDIAHPHYTSSARWCSDPNPDYNPCVGVA